MNLRPALLEAARRAVQALRAVGGVKAVVVATSDGFDVASEAAHGIDPARVAAMASSIGAIALVAAQEGGLNDCDQMTVGAKDGFFHLRHARHPELELIIAVIAGESAVLAQVHYFTAEQVRLLVVA
ncbi:MAG: roadblock/LC7 domain-containing protein [Pseudomonadota bacterium]